MHVCIVPQDIQLRNELSNAVIVIWTVKVNGKYVDVCSKQDLVNKGFHLNLEEFDYEPEEEPMP